AVGSAQKYRNFVFVTLGTGIGGGIVLNGEVLEGENGAAGEIGHMQVAYDNKRRCNCGRYGCHERYASATGLVLTAKELMIGKKTILQGVELSSKVIFDFAKAGDAVALQAVEMMVDTLGRTLANIAAVLNPEAFVIGGGVSKAGTFLLEKVQDKFQKYCFYTLKDTKFELASLGNDAGIYGTSYAVR
ncbi:MAG: ROK family protein, partial [Bacilli bacterium]|nr:ROK family protein [Bacilli bacterium]